MPTKTDNIDMQNLLLEVLNVNSSFGQEMRDKITSVFDSVTENLKNKINKMETSNDSISIDSIMSVDPANKEKTGKQFEAIQKRVLIQLREVAKAQNFKQLKGGINITDIMTSNKVENSRIERKYNIIRNNLLKTVKAAIPSKIKLKELFGISEELSKGKTPWSLPKDLFEKPDKLNPYEPPPTYKEKEEKKEEKEPKEGGFVKDILNKLDKDIGPSDLAEEGKTKGREEFFEKENKPQLFILDGISDNAMASLTKIMGGMKIGGMGIGKTKEGGGLFGGILGKLFGGMGIPSWIVALGPILALVGGLIWLGIDAFAGWMKAEEWGVGKVSGMMGSLLGGTGSGLKNAFKNMGKWALIGAGIGSIVPGIGTIIGGLIGAAFGFIMGWIGGERIAKAWQAVTDWVAEKMLAIYEWFTKFWGASWGEKWKMIKDAFFGLIKWYGELFMGIVNWIDEKMYALFGDSWTQLQDAVASVFVWIGEQAVAIGDWFAGIWKKFTGFINSLIDGVAKVFEWIGFIMGWIGGERIAKAWQAVTDWVAEKMLAIYEWFTKFWGASWGEKWKMIKDAFFGLIKWYGELFMGIVNWIDEKMYALFGDSWTQLQDAVASVFVWIGEQAVAIGDWFAGIWKKFTGFINSLIDGVAKVFEWIGEQAVAIGNWFANIGTHLGNGWRSFVDGLASIINWLHDKIEAAKNWLAEQFSWVPGVTSPSELEKKKREESAAHHSELSSYANAGYDNMIEAIKQGNREQALSIAKVLESRSPEHIRKQYGTAEEYIAVLMDKASEAAKGSNYQNTDINADVMNVPEVHGFFARAGEGPVRVPEDDNVFGVANGKSMNVHDIDMSKNMKTMNDTMNNIAEKMIALYNVNKEMLKMGTHPMKPQPLPSIPEHVTAAKALASDEATIYKTKIWEIIHGV